MAITQHRSKRKPSGGRYKSGRKKRVYELAGKPVLTLMADVKKRIIRGKGGNKKQKLLSSNIVNVTVKGKSLKAKVLSVVGNQANPNFIRRNIITKGAIVETDIGKVKISSRPGQDGILNGIKVE